jgi:hypothetical protein
MKKFLILSLFALMCFLPTFAHTNRVEPPPKEAKSISIFENQEQTIPVFSFEIQKQSLPIPSFDAEKTTCEKFDTQTKQLISFLHTKSYLRSGKTKYKLFVKNRRI